MSWKYCFNLSCLNNSKKNPEKYYFRVPYNKDLREKWCKAVDRPALSLKPSSTAYCCSDHFNMVEDLDPFKSTSTSPKLQKSVMPSKCSNISSHSGEKMAEIEDIFGTNVLGEETTDITELDEEGRYVREVVYIEENDNDQFLQENVEDTDGLSIAHIDERENETAKAVVEISDDDNLLNAVATAIKSFKPSENVLKVKKSLKVNTGKYQSNSLVNRIVDSSEHQMKVQKEVVALKTQAAVKNETATTKSFKAIEGKMVTSRPIMKVLGKISAARLHEIRHKVPHPPKESSSVQHKTVASIPPSKNLILSSKTQETCKSLVPINTPLKFETRAVNVSKYQTRLPSKIIPSVRYQIAKTSQEQPMSAYVMSRQIRMKDQQNELPIKRYKESVDDDDCILIDEPASKCNSNTNEVQNKLSLVSSPKFNSSSGLLIKKLPACISVKSNAVPQIPNMQLTTAASNTTISRLVRAEPSSSTSALRITNNQSDQELQLIKLILLENPSICKSSASKGASKTVKIIRSKKNQFQIADNIYYYRTNYQFPKNYFFMNITRNLCQSYETIQRNYGIYWGRPRISCVGIVETRGILDDETKDFVFIQVKKPSKSKPVMIQSVIRKSKNNSLQPSNTNPEIINLDDDENEIVPKTKTNPLVNFLTTVKMSPFDRPLLTQNTTRVSSNEIPTHQIVQQSPVKDLDMTDPIELRKKVSYEVKKDGFVQVYKRLIPSMRKQINKYKYFEMSNGAVYTVTIGPNYTLPFNEHPFNVVFQKNSPGSNIQPVSRHLSVSKLVNDIFDTIHTETNLGPLKKQDMMMIVSNEKKNPTLKVIHSELADDTIPVGEPIKVAKQSDKIIPVGELIKPNKFAGNIIPVFEPIKLATTTGNIKITSPSTAVKSPIKNTMHSQSTVTIPVDIVLTKVPSPKKNKYVVINTNDRNKRFKYKCDVCAKGFDRAYKFRRHQFVRHTLDKVDANLIPTDGVSNIVSEPNNEQVEETVVRKHIPTPQQLFTSNVESKLVIKKEKLDITDPNETAIPDDICLPDDKTLLIPLFEIPMEEQSDKDYLHDFSLANVKQEPEEHFEDVMVMPLPPVNFPSQQKKVQKTVQKQPKRIYRKPNLPKPNLEKNTDSSTDSATEVVPYLEKKVKQKRKIKTKKLPKKIVRKNCKVVEKKIKRRRKTKKILKKIVQNVKIRNSGKSPMVPVVSKVKQLMMNLPECYVNLTTISKQS